MVESPKDPPSVDFGANLSTRSESPQSSGDIFDERTEEIKSKQTFDFDDISQPIDVNKPRDTSNIFYAYEEPTEKLEPEQIIEQTLENQMKSEEDKEKAQSADDTSQSNENKADDDGENIDNEKQQTSVNRDSFSS